MPQYKVFFQNNVAISATPLDEKEVVIMRMSTNEKGLEWFIVFGYSEADAMSLAEQVVQGDLLKFVQRLPTSR